MSERRRTIVVALLLAVLVLAVFGRAVGFEYLNYDDPEYVTGNASVQAGWSLESVRWALTTTWNSYWHPLTWLSHLTDRTLFGAGPAGPHAMNVLLHAANTLLVFGWLRMATGALGRSALVAALFAVHPLHVESVAWVAERKDVLSAFFFLLTLVCYTRYAQRRQTSEPDPLAHARSYIGGSLLRHPWFAAAFGCFVLAAASKPMVVTLPCVLLLLDVWPLRRVAIDGASLRTWARLGVEKLPFFAIALALSIVTWRAQQANGAMASLDALPLAGRAANAAVSYVRYLGHLVWPVDLAVFYPPVERWSALAVTAAVALLVAITALAFRGRREHPPVLVGWLWFVGMLVPVIGLVQVGDQALADRYTYLPLVGCFVALTWGLADFVGARAVMVPSFLRLARVAAVAVVALGVVRTTQQLSVWHDSETLFGHAIAVTSRNFVAHNNLGSALLQRGDVAGAIEQFTRSAELQPDYAPPHSNLGLVLLQQGRAAEAVPHLERALAVQPDFAEVHFNLAEALRLSGGAEAGAAGALRSPASRHYERAAALRPDLAPAQFGWGVDLLSRGESDRAIVALTRAVELDGSEPRAWAALGDALLEARRAADALEPLRRSLALAPNPPVQFRYGAALLSSGQAIEAAAQFGQLVEANPADAELRNAHGWALLAAGRLTESVAALREAVRLDPNSSRYRSNLQQALSRLESSAPLARSL